MATITITTPDTTATTPDPLHPPLLRNGRANLRTTVPTTVATARAVLGILIVTMTGRTSTDATHLGNTRTTLSASMHTAALVKRALLLLPPLLFLTNGRAELRHTTPPDMPDIATVTAVLGILLVTMSRC